SRDTSEGYRSQGPRRLLKAAPEPTPHGGYQKCEKFWTLPWIGVGSEYIRNVCRGAVDQSNFRMKLLWRPRERTPAAKAQAQFICAVKRRSERNQKKT
ncbi:MAG: hypothetical protein LBP61_07425, partial [Desulfovibrio sp.]|nr:hypothetical protein [Desulfovibrio sp.]